MRRTLGLITGFALIVLALLAPSGAASAATTAAATRGTILAFALTASNTTVAPSGGMMAEAGDWIQVTGGGTVTPATRRVSAGGAFVHYDADGTVHCSGTWTASTLTGWTDFGAAANGEHGGVISMLVTHRCTTMGMVHTDIPMTVTSTRVAPIGSTYVEGVTVGEFTRPTSGGVTIRASAG